MPISVNMQVRDIHKAFGAFKALDGVTLDIVAGELVCLLGPSGCGKTTLLRCIAGLEQQDRGTIMIGARDVSHLAPQARDYGILFQSYALFPNLTVEQNIGYGLNGNSRETIRGRVAEMLDLVAWAAARRNTPASCPAASNSEWLWPAPWHRRPRCCCWMNPCRPSMRGCANTCVANCANCRSAWASPP